MKCFGSFSMFNGCCVCSLLCSFVVAVTYWKIASTWILDSIQGGWDGYRRRFWKKNPILVVANSTTYPFGISTQSWLVGFVYCTRGGKKSHFIEPLLFSGQPHFFFASWHTPWWRCEGSLSGAYWHMLFTCRLTSRWSFFGWTIRFGGKCRLIEGQK